MKAQHGVSLVELMVAVTIGLFLVLGLGTMFYSMRQTFIARQALSALQDSERMAMTFLAAGIQGAGYYPNALTMNTATQFPASGSFAAGQSVSGTTGGAANTDTLSVRFVTPLTGVSNTQGCSASLLANTSYTDVYSVTGGNLVCTENGTAIPLVAGVSGMSVLYGVDTTGNGSVTEYQLANTVTWPQVKTVSITLLFNNPLSGQSGQPQTVSFTRVVPYMNGL
ncbi:MAG: PilW family protein [Sulfuriferula sp.]|nr:PilW family protein [Sulfuriferula sp.]